MAREAARLLEGSNWLPEPLRLAGGEPAIENEPAAAAQDEEAAELPAFLANSGGELRSARHRGRVGP